MAEIEDLCLGRMSEDADSAKPSQPAPQSQKKSQNDPRDENFVLKYESSNFNKATEQEGSIADFYQLMSVVFGMVAFLMREKWAAWCALFIFYCSCINTKAAQRMQHIFTGISIVMISFTNIYFAPKNSLSTAQMLGLQSKPAVPPQ